MKVLVFDQQAAMHMARVYSSLLKPRYRHHRLTPAFTKDGRYTINASVLDQTGEDQRFKHYVNVIEWNKGNIIDVTYEDYDHDNWNMLIGHNISLEELPPSDPVVSVDSSQI